MSDKLPTKTALRKMAAADLAQFGRQHCLLEHLSDNEIAALSKTQLLNAVLGAFARIEIEEDRRAMATDTTSKSVAEVIGYVEGTGTVLAFAEPKAGRKGRKAAAPEVPIAELNERNQLPAALTAVCRTCQQELPVSKFPTKAAGKDGTVGREDRCRACRAEARAARKLANA